MDSALVDTYGGLIEALRILGGEKVQAQFRLPGGDHLTVTGILAEPEELLDVGLVFAIGDAGRVALHFDQFEQASVFSDRGGVTGVLVHYGVGQDRACMLRITLKDDAG